MTALSKEISQQGAADTLEHSGYIRLPVSFFQGIEAPLLRVYSSWSNTEGQPILIAAPGKLEAWQLREVLNAGHKCLCVQSEEFNTISKDLLNNLEELVADPSCPAEERFLVLQSVVAREVDLAFRSTNSERLVSASKRIGGQITKLVSSRDVTPRQLFELAQHDTTTFVHATNVAAYATLLADAIGGFDEQDLQSVAVGAMLHDLGKRDIPQEVLTKKGRLNARERDLIERHPQLGFEALCHRDDLSFGQLMMVYQHHEWIDGSGYPVGAPGEEIHPWAKLLAVVDVFDALTADRPYHEGMDSAEALKLIEDRAGVQFEEEPVRCWTSLCLA